MADKTSPNKTRLNKTIAEMFPGQYETLDPEFLDMGGFFNMTLGEVSLTQADLDLNLVLGFIIDKKAFSQSPLDGVQPPMGNCLEIQVCGCRTAYKQVITESPEGVILSPPLDRFSMFMDTDPEDRKQVTLEAVAGFISRLRTMEPKDWVENITWDYQVAIPHEQREKILDIFNGANTPAELEERLANEGMRSLLGVTDGRIFYGVLDRSLPELLLELLRKKDKYLTDQGGWLENKLRAYCNPNFYPHLLRGGLKRMTENQQRLLSFRMSRPFTEVVEDGINKAELVVDSDLLYGDCKSDFLGQLGEKVSFPHRLSYRLKQDVDDNTFLNEALSLPSRIKMGGGVAFPPPQRTQSAVINGAAGPYFVKVLNLTKVPYADYELAMADEMRKSGIKVPEPMGMMLLDNTPLLVFEYIENAVNLLGQDHQQRQKAALAKLLESHEPEVYRALGAYVHSLSEKGFTDGDMAQRNFLATFSPEGAFQEVMMVDFEKSKRELPIPQLQKDEAVNKLFDQLSEVQKEDFKNGYKNGERSS